MTPDPFLSLVGDLTPFFGSQVAAAVGAAMVIIVCVAHGVMPWIPVPDGKSSSMYHWIYGMLRLLAGNYGNAAPGGQQ